MTSVVKDVDGLYQADQEEEDYSLSTDEDSAAVASKASSEASRTSELGSESASSRS